MTCKRFLTQKQLYDEMNQSSDSEVYEKVEQNDIVLNKNTCVVYIPPATVDAVSDEECIDENDLMTDIAPNLETCGEVEIEYESNVVDFAGPHIPPATNVELQPVPSLIQHSEVEYTAEAKNQMN